MAEMDETVTMLQIDMLACAVLNVQAGDGSHPALIGGAGQPADASPAPTGQAAGIEDHSPAASARVPTRAAAAAVGTTQVGF